MALFDCDFFSEKLAYETRVKVYIPDLEKKPDKLLYLLHGRGDDCSAWIRNSLIEQFAKEHQIMVVMPTAEDGFYTDSVHGKKYFTYITEELPEGGEQPLSGVRVLDMTRILAGPTCGLGLTEHGADDLMVTAPSLPQIDAFVRDTSHGKRSCYLDYTDEKQAAVLQDLLKEADIFIEGYRPGSMKKHGFSPEDIMKIRPGIICVSVNCFGDEGEYGDRAGWDQVAQAVTGICKTQGEAAGTGIPALTPVFVCDFLTGLLGSYGAKLALARRAKEGGSYHVKVSLCKSAMLLQRQGLRDDSH